MTEGLGEAGMFGAGEGSEGGVGMNSLNIGMVRWMG